MLVCLSLFSGCTDDKENSHSRTDLDNAVEIDIDADGKGNAEVSDNDSNKYEFREPENADGIEIVLRE